MKLIICFLISQSVGLWNCIGLSRIELPRIGISRLMRRKCRLKTSQIVPSHSEDSYSDSSMRAQVSFLSEETTFEREITPPFDFALHSINIFWPGDRHTPIPIDYTTAIDFLHENPNIASLDIFVGTDSNKEIVFQPVVSFTRYCIPSEWANAFVSTSFTLGVTYEYSHFNTQDNSLSLE